MKVMVDLLAAFEIGLFIGLIFCGVSHGAPPLGRPCAQITKHLALAPDPKARADVLRGLGLTEQDGQECEDEMARRDPDGAQQWQHTHPGRAKHGRP